MRPASIPRRSCRPTTASRDWRASARHGAASRSCRRNKSKTSWHISQRYANRKNEPVMSQEYSTRRQFLGLTGSAAVVITVPIVTLRPARATPAMLAAAIRNVVGEAVVRPGKVKLEVPPLVENGNTVPMTVNVFSPMTPEDYVKSIHVFNEKNPQPNVGNFYLGPHAARAQVSPRIP